MNKEYKLSYEDKKLIITCDFTEIHLQTLLIINANGGFAEFENRKLGLNEDIDGNYISWQTCDELVEMGLLYEDEESYSVFFEITKDGKDLIEEIKNMI